MKFENIIKKTFAYVVVFFHQSKGLLSEQFIKENYSSAFLPYRHSWSFPKEQFKLFSNLKVMTNFSFDSEGHTEVASRYEQNIYMLEGFKGAINQQTGCTSAKGTRVPVVVDVRVPYGNKK